MTNGPTPSLLVPESVRLTGAALWSSCKYMSTSVRAIVFTHQAVELGRLFL
jgi:hypothetical protein